MDKDSMMNDLTGRAMYEAFNNSQPENNRVAWDFLRASDRNFFCAAASNGRAKLKEKQRLWMRSLVDRDFWFEIWFYSPEDPQPKHIESMIEYLNVWLRGTKKEAKP